jgi:NADPH:quinone reductase-like Zn-dependent oxidoreductase
MMSVVAPAQETTTMKAIVYREYGSPDVLELRDVEKPGATDDSVLVRVHAASANPADWHGMTGSPFLARTTNGLRKPKAGRLGIDFAGTVEAVGKKMAGFKEGDEVFGGRTGAFAEYVSVKNAIAPKPPNITFEEAAAVPVAGVTALQGLRDKGELQPGQKVLINGASGGVGTFAVQIAKALGAEVTGICSTRNVDMVRSLGADRVIDYTQEDFTRGEERYDLLADIGGGRTWSDLTRVLAPEGKVVMIGGPISNRLTGVSVRHLIRLRLTSLFGGHKGTFFIAKLNRPDLEFLAELITAGKVKPVVERRYELGEIAEAMGYVGTKHCRAKLVIDVVGTSAPAARQSADATALA